MIFFCFVESPSERRKILLGSWMPPPSWQLEATRNLALGPTNAAVGRSIPLYKTSCFSFGWNTGCHMMPRIVG